jgi:hypothetical protein
LAGAAANTPGRSLNRRFEAFIRGLRVEALVRIHDRLGVS